MKVPETLTIRCGLAILSGAIYAGAFPPLDWGWMVIPGILGLLLALHGQSGSRARLIGFLHGMIAYGLSLSWLLNLFGPVAIILWCVLALFTAIFAGIQGSLNLRAITGWKLALFTAANWCALEFIRSEIFPLKLPWMTAGLAMGPNLLLPWIGVYGVSFVVLCLVGFAFHRKWITATAIAAILLACVFFSKPHPLPSPGDPGTVRVAGLQLEGVSLNEYLAGTRDMPAGIDHVVWPEYSVPFDIRENKRDWKIVTDLCREKDITLTFGTQARKKDSEEWRNIALTIDSTGALGEHTKVHTVHFFNDGTPGQSATPVETPFGKVGTPICFDCDYEGVVRKMTAAGAEYLVVPTMDAESWSARQHDQHAELARIRAAENGRWLFVVATSGVSQLTDPSGHLHARLGAMRQGEISGTLKRETKLTFYTRYGWVFPWIILTLAVALWLWLVFKAPPFRSDHSGILPGSFEAVRVAKRK